MQNYNNDFLKRSCLCYTNDSAGVKTVWRWLSCGKGRSLLLFVCDPSPCRLCISRMRLQQKMRPRFSSLPTHPARLRFLSRCGSRVSKWRMLPKLASCCRRCKLL